MNETRGLLVTAADDSVECGGLLRCSVHVSESTDIEIVEVRLAAVVTAGDVVVHRDRWSSAKTVQRGGFEAGDVVMIEVDVPVAAPISRRLAGGSLEWQIEAWSGDVCSRPTSVVVTPGARRRPLVGESPTVTGVSWFVAVLTMAIAASLMYPAVLVSRSYSSPWPAIGVGGVVVLTAGLIGLAKFRKEPFPFKIVESAVFRGGALQIELEGPTRGTCTARLVTTIDRVESSGDYYDIDRRVIDGPISKIAPGVVRTVVAVPADTHPKSVSSVDRDTDILTRHFVHVERFGSRERSLLRTSASRRSVDIRE